MRISQKRHIMATPATLCRESQEAQVALREEKDATYLALTTFGALREQAVQAFSLTDDAMTRTLDAWLALLDLLEIEAPHLVYKVGQYITARDLEITAQDLDTIINNATVRENLLNMHREGVRRLKQLYLS